MGLELTHDLSPWYFCLLPTSLSPQEADADSVDEIAKRLAECTAAAGLDTAKVTACTETAAKETAALAGSGSVVVNIALLVGAIVASLGMAKAV